ncbi:hypothetical protein CONCODRAFT_19952 [Conidiobolus coronatus NRRL 28638]|uniref:Mss4-like protein n=1 Tax=Conidiobolus coronatus (strain ATCC 28846 / CBS 209.66 / NRRL 28638) TaxID=796925 RepID=A0A137NVW7_CONC2|nr:hypothetical protein CONCODRAFT_19952 [Conidiobolus coronatus NRRL 28638]|eukprot:KXN66916.1 hypothetical protein CONCODRAFT_19952 [Conidiobolus coronatus NRRL 28638]
MSSTDSSKIESLQVKYYCKPNNCRSTILNKSVGQFKLIKLPNNWPTNIPVNTNENGEVTAVEVASMMDFDNVGVSKPIEGQSAEYRLLTCADCDQGPIGYLIYPKGPAFLFSDLCKIVE